MKKLILKTILLLLLPRQTNLETKNFSAKLEVQGRPTRTDRRFTFKKTIVLIEAQKGTAEDGNVRWILSQRLQVNANAVKKLTTLRSIQFQKFYFYDTSSCRM